MSKSGGRMRRRYGNLRRVLDVRKDSGEGLEVLHAVFIYIQG